MSDRPIYITVRQSERGWDVYTGSVDETVSWPMTSYPNSVLAAARVLQLMEISMPIAPQQGPESIQIGSVDHD